MSTPQQPPGQQGAFVPKPQQDTIPLKRHPISHLETYDVTAQELRSIERESLDVGQDFAFASNALSIAATLLISLIFNTPESPKVFATFVAADITMGALSAYFFICYFRKRRGTKSTIQEIRDRQIGPVGEEGRELRPADLAALPVTQLPAPPAPAPAETSQPTETHDTAQTPAPATDAAHEPIQTAGEQK